MKTQKGFTIGEVLFVLILLSIAAMIGLSGIAIFKWLTTYIFNL